MFGRAKKPQSAEQVMEYLHGPITKSTAMGGHWYIRSIEGRSAFLPFGSGEAVYFTAHALRGPQVKIDSYSLVTHQYSLGQTSCIHFVEVRGSKGIHDRDQVTFEAPYSSLDGRYYAVGEGVLRLLQGFDREESERLRRAEFRRSQELIEEADRAFPIGLDLGEA